MLVQQAHNRFDLGSWVVAVEGVAGKFVGREGGGGQGLVGDKFAAVVWSGASWSFWRLGVGRHIFHRPANKSILIPEKCSVHSVN